MFPSFPFLSFFFLTNTPFPAEQSGKTTGESIAPFTPLTYLLTHEKSLTTETYLIQTTWDQRQYGFLDFLGSGVKVPWVW